MIIISDYDISKLEIASDLINIVIDKRILLFSDALYLLRSTKTKSLVDNMLKKGVTFLALETEMKKRGFEEASSQIVKSTYEELVQQLLEQNTGTVNL